MTLVVSDRPRIFQKGGLWHAAGWGRCIPTTSFKLAQEIIEYGYFSRLEEAEDSTIARRKLRAVLALGVAEHRVASHGVTINDLFAALVEGTTIPMRVRSCIDRAWDTHKCDAYTPPVYSERVFWPLPMDWEDITNLDEHHDDHALVRVGVWMERIVTDGVRDELAELCGVSMQALWLWRKNGAPEHRWEAIYRIFKKTYEEVRK
ncbi:hypothetical protein FRC0522_00466 [Corynebacterium diphtheriae]|nr:hypothetical protein FRC0522_00466 [Corynebacterium diphtheriae]